MPSTPLFLGGPSRGRNRVSRGFGRHAEDLGSSVLLEFGSRLGTRRSFAVVYHPGFVEGVFLFFHQKKHDFGISFLNFSNLT